MDVVRLSVPYRFLEAQLRPTWRDVWFGLVHELLDVRAPAEMAAQRVLEAEAPSIALIELSSAKGEATTRVLVEQLAALEPVQSDEQVRDRWLFLSLAWLYEHREQCSNPLQRVEEVYADFGYPKEVASFVRYMPMEGPDLGSREANEARLLERWKRFVEDARARLAVR